MKTIKFLTLAVLTVVFGLFLTSSAQASTLQNVKLTLNDSQPSVSSTHQFNFSHTTGTSIKKMTFQYCKQASGSCTQTSTDFTDENFELSTFSKATGGVTETDFTTTVSGSTISIEMITGYVDLNASEYITATFSPIGNGPFDNCDGNGGDTDTCFVWLKTYSGATGAVLIDTGTATYTLINAVTIAARVDPTFTFVISTVDANTVHNEITTSVASTPTELLFGSLTAGTPKYAAHALSVTTNTATGYSITVSLPTQMAGVITANNIDPFMHTWASPSYWTEPTGTTPNDNTGWLGANTTDTDIGQWTTAPERKFGAINASAATVSYKTSPDNGTTPVYVTYAIEANVFQASDYYSGTLTYNALPTY